MARRKSNKQVKAMICSGVDNHYKGQCGEVWWDYIDGEGFLVVDGALDIEFTFVHSAGTVSIKANQD